MSRRLPYQKKCTKAPSPVPVNSRQPAQIVFEAPINNGGIFESRQTSSFALAQSAFPPLHGSIPLSLIPQAPTRAHPPSPSPPSANLSVVPLRLSYSSPVPILLPSYSSPSPKIIILQLPWRVTWFPFTEIHMQMSQIPHASRFVSTILDASKL